MERKKFNAYIIVKSRKRRKKAIFANDAMFC